MRLKPRASNPPQGFTGCIGSIPMLTTRTAKRVAEKLGARIECRITESEKQDLMEACFALDVSPSELFRLCLIRGFPIVKEELRARAQDQNNIFKL